MRKLRVIELLTLDGVMQAPADPDEDREEGFEHGGWQRPYGDDVLGAAAGKGMATTDAYLFGRKTYEHMVAYWPNVSDDDPYARHMNHSPKYVVSKTLRHVEWEHSCLIDGDVADEVSKLKDQPGQDIAVLGSGDLVQTLIAADLVDEYFLAVYPIVLGEGKRLFRDPGVVRRLRLVESEPTTTGGVILTYRQA